MPQSTITRDEIDKRIIFHDDDEIMEVVFEDLRFESSADVNAFYDRVEERIAETGEPKWFFLVNYRNNWIDPSAWFAFSRRGRDVNLAHSMGSVRFDASEATKRQIERAAGNENFDPNLFYERDEAVARLRSLPSQRKARRAPVTHSFGPTELARILDFDTANEIMHVDFSGMSFEHSEDVDDVYDHIEQEVRKTGRKWYFLVNLEGTQIQPPAWVRYAARGKTLNEATSLGSVRYAPGSETESDIRMRAESQGFRPNIRNTREEAVARIDELKRAALDA